MAKGVSKLPRKQSESKAFRAYMALEVIVSDRDMRQAVIAALRAAKLI